MIDPQDALTKVTVYLANGKGVEVDMIEGESLAAIETLGSGNVACFRDMNTGEETWLPSHSVAFVSRRSPRMKAERAHFASLARMGDESAPDALTKVSIFLSSGTGVAVDMDEILFASAVNDISAGKIACFYDKYTGEEKWIPPHAVGFVHRQSPRMKDQREARLKLAQSGGIAAR